MKKKNVQSIIIFMLLFAFLAGSFLMISPVEDADAWWRHECNCKNVRESGMEVDPATGNYRYVVRFVRRCEIFWHLSPFPHEWSCP